MSKPVSIIMYHYVRELKYSRYPSIKGLSTEDFIKQISYFKKHYHIIGAYDLMDAVEFGSDLPPNSLLLTFDDGYIDHFTQVLPILDKEKISACFFPSGKGVLENHVLDVNKIHFILANGEKKGSLIEHIWKSLDKHRSEYGLESNEYYWEKLGKASRFDSAKVRFVKRLLQLELPKNLRKTIINDLFCKLVTSDEKAFSKELYMSVDQISYLQRNGMYVGSHGFDHYWLDSLPKNEQEREIDLSLDFLKGLGSDIKGWIMCYRHGAFNKSLLSVLKHRNCIVGLTTRIGIADLNRNEPFTLKRLDTNDLPKKSNEAPNFWTQKVMEGQEE